MTEVPLYVELEPCLYTKVLSYKQAQRYKQTSKAQLGKGFFLTTWEKQLVLNVHSLLLILMFIRCSFLVQNLILQAFTPIKNLKEHIKDPSLETQTAT